MPDSAPLFETKVCARCERPQPLNAFPFHHKSGTRIKTCRHCMPQYKRGGNKRRASTRAWQRANAEKRKAHKAVEYAIKRGDLAPQPCERCGTEEKVHAHHDDYSKPLDVMWLCPLHHGERHRELRKPILETLAPGGSGALL